jgi:hypothetical protein
VLKGKGAAKEKSPYDESYGLGSGGAEDNSAQTVQVSQGQVDQTIEVRFIILNLETAI